VNRKRGAGEGFGGETLTELCGEKKLKKSMSRNLRKKKGGKINLRLEDVFPPLAIKGKKTECLGGVRDPPRRRTDQEGRGGGKPRKGGGKRDSRQQRKSASHLVKESERR